MPVAQRGTRTIVLVTKRLRLGDSPGVQLDLGEVARDQQPDPEQLYWYRRKNPGSAWLPGSLF